jgi:tetratricopeptide (TPR) repeat protein
MTSTASNTPTTLSSEQAIELSSQQYRDGQFDLALATCQQLIAFDLGHAMAWSNASAALASLGRWIDALAYARQALAITPGLPDAQNNLAHILAALSRSHEAGAVLRNLGWAQHLAKEPAAALATYERALAINPNDVEALHVLAGLQSEGENKHLALSLMNRALAINPHHLPTLAAKGNLIGCWDTSRDGEWRPKTSDMDFVVAENTEQARLVQAEQCFTRALSIDPNHWMTLYNYGVFAASQMRHSQAIDLYDRAGRADPNHHLSFWNLSNLLLRLGDYERAWPLYEWRWQTDHLKPAYLQLPMPLWTGQDLQGKRILLHFEQGYGDGFQFIRFAKDVAARGAHVTIFMPKEICENFEGVAGVHEIRPWNDVPQGFDFHAPLMSLPAALGLTTQNIPNAVPYLFAKPERVQVWQQRLPALTHQQKWRVGIAWCGRPTHDNDKNRSIAFTQIQPLIDAFPRTQFISMQVGPRESDLPALDACKNIIRVETAIQDFSDTAALATQLDLLISVDTSVVHLAAALGKRVWVLIPAASDWRWLQNEGATAVSTPWYPNVRLFRQSNQEGQDGNWGPVLARVQAELGLLQQAA